MSYFQKKLNRVFELPSVEPTLASLKAEMGLDKKLINDNIKLEYIEEPIEEEVDANSNRK